MKRKPCSRCTASLDCSPFTAGPPYLQGPRINGAMWSACLLQRHFMQTGELQLTQTLTDVSWGSHQREEQKQELEVGVRTGFGPDDSPKRRSKAKRQHKGS